MSADRIGVGMHGVRLALEVDHAALMAYAVRHLHGLVEEPAAEPDLRVRCSWSEGSWDSESNPFPADGALNVIGKRMLGNRDELIWLDTLRMPGLQLRLRRLGERWAIDVAYRYHPKPKHLHERNEYEYKKFFALMSYLVYYPIFWHMERYRGCTVLHASALAGPEGGILIGGLGGVGKTTLCMALLKRSGFSLGAENIVLTDGALVYPCYEPIRLDQNSLALLGDAPAGLTPMDFPDGLKDKQLFHVRRDPAAERFAPRALFLPQFSPRRYVTPIDPAHAAERLLAVNRLTRELDDYGWFASAPDMHWPRAGQALERIGALERFARATPCFEVGIDRTAGVAAVVEDILGCLA